MQLTRENNFDFLRFWAAFLVLVGHSYPLYGLPYEGFSRLTNIDTLGGFSVTTFFVISGFLITASFERSPSVRDYFFNRLLRIFPGLVAVVLFSLLLLGPIVSGLSFEEYIRHPQARDYLSSILIYPAKGALPGAFTQNPYPHEVNGSLWTLRFEFTMYIVVALLGLAKLLNRNWLPFILVLLLVAHFHITQSSREDIYIFNMKLEPLVKLGVAFFAGAVAYIWREKIPVSHRLFTLSMILMVGSAATPFARFAFVIFLPYVILYLGFVRLPFGISRFGKYGDFSYGFYIYAFPMQQLYMYLVGDLYGFTGLVIGSAGVTFVLAVLSWYFVEKQALKFKRKSLRPVEENISSKKFHYAEGVI